MDIPLKEQLDNQHPKAEKHCEGCYGSGWLTVASFLMKCDECKVFETDEQAAEAACSAGMEFNDNLVVTYTKEQLAFLKGMKPIENPKLWLIHQLGGIMERLADEIPQIISVSCDGDHKSAEIIIDVFTNEGVRSLLIGTAGIKDVSDDE